MPCYRIPMKHGGHAFLCGDLGPHCAAEKCADVSGFLCDYPVGNNKTCDLPLCQSHAFETAPDIHYCPGHLILWQQFVADGKVDAVLESITPFSEALLDLKKENRLLKERIHRLTEPSPLKPKK